MEIVEGNQEGEDDRSEDIVVELCRSEEEKLECSGIVEKEAYSEDNSTYDISLIIITELLASERKIPESRFPCPSFMPGENGKLYQDHK